MSTTTNTQSFLPYIFRPSYAYTSTGFNTSFNIRNIDTVTANALTVGQLQVGDSNSNMYIGSSTVASANILTNNNTSNTIIGVNAGLGISNTTGLESVGFGSGQNANYVTTSSFVGQSAGCNANTILNSLFMGANAGSNSKNLSNSLFIGAGAGAYNLNASNVIAIGVGAAAYLPTLSPTPNYPYTSVGSSNIFIGTSNGVGLTGTNNVIIGHSVNSTTFSSNPYYNSGSISPLYVLPNFSNKLYIGSGSNILMTGDFTTGCISIGTPNATPYSVFSTTTGSVTTWNPLTLGLQLEVKKYARIGNGLGIGIDPGYYTLDVNGQFRVSDGSGLIALSNKYDGVTNTTGAATASYVEMKPVSGGTMVLDVTGQINARNGVYSIQSGSNGVTVPATGSSLTLSNVLPTMKNGSNWTGGVVGFLMASASQYYAAQFAVLNGVQGGLYASSTNLIFSISGSNIVISNTSASSLTGVVYNFTLYPAF